MKSWLPILVLLGCAAALVFGIEELFQLRFEVGDVYPAYSSLRSDPLGTMALYESLEQIPGLSARRDYSTTGRLPDGKGTTYFHLAVDSSEWDYAWDSLPTDTFRNIEQFLAGGGRLVITLFPESSSGPHFFGYDREQGQTDSKPDKNGESPGKKMTRPEQPDKSGAKRERDREKRTEADDTVSLKDRWGIDFEVRNLVQDPNGTYEAARAVNQTGLALPRSLDWHSGIVCTNLDPGWRTIYARGTNAVVIERRLDGGTVVIATDSYFLSNEAMAKDRHADFLAWLVGSGRKIVFDEAHLGVTEAPGVATLMRKYRLYWLVAGLLLLAGLFIWKNSSSLAPPLSDESRQDYIVGKDAASGFVNLLRRSIPRRDLLATCFAEWKKSSAQPGRLSAARLRQAEALFQTYRSADREQQPVAAYREIARVLQHPGFQVPSPTPEPGPDPNEAEQPPRIALP